MTHTPSNKKQPGFFTRLVIRLVINACALYIASLVVSGIHIEGWGTILGISIIFGLVNAFIKPFVSCLTCLIQIVTLGLFTLIINAGMLYLTKWFADWFDLDFTIDNFFSAILGAIIISIVSLVLSKILR